MNERLLGQLLGRGSLNVPQIIFSKLKVFGLTPSEGFMLLTLWYFRYQEENLAPSEDDLKNSLGIEEEEVLILLSQLMEKKMINYEEGEEGIVYSLTPFLEKILELIEEKKPEVKDEKVLKIQQAEADEKTKVRKNIYETLEGEFGKLLSPIEVEQIKEWLDDFGYSEQMILEALNATVRRGKLSLNYINSILRDWAKKGVTTEAENEALAKKSKVSVKKEVSKPKKKNYKNEDIYLN